MLHFTLTTCTTIWMTGYLSCPDFTGVVISRPHSDEKQTSQCFMYMYAFSLHEKMRLFFFLRIDNLRFILPFHRLAYNFAARIDIHVHDLPSWPKNIALESNDHVSLQTVDLIRRTDVDLFSELQTYLATCRIFPNGPPLPFYNTSPILL